MSSLIVCLKTFGDLNGRQLPVIQEAGTDPVLSPDHAFAEECQEYGVRAYVYDGVEAARSALLSMLHANASHRFWVAETTLADGSCVHNVITYETDLCLPIMVWDMRTNASRDLIADKNTIQVIKPNRTAVKAYIVLPK